MSQLTLITPTSDRPAAFRICERWMDRALNHFAGDVQWIVADDGVAPVDCTLGQVHIWRSPAADRRGSFLGNLLTAIRRARHEKVLFIEDDDWYAPDYLRTMHSWLDGADIVGEGRARYYNVATRRFHLCSNGGHASLCQTGIRRELVPWMIDHIERFHRVNIDLHLWKTGAKGKRQALRPESTRSAGIKGLPGKAGIGIGHRLGPGNSHDADGTVLRRWIGREDAEMYLKLSSIAASAVS